MKKLLIVLGIFLALIIGAVFILPGILKPKIKKAVDQGLSDNLNAIAYYDGSSLRLSLLRSFPNLTVNLDNFGLVGLAPFENDTLVHVGKFTVTLDLMSVINGSAVDILDLVIEDMNLNILVLADGTANYDIVKESDTDEVQTDSGEDVPIIFHRWELRNADIIYYDASLAFYTTLFGVEHIGSGDFSQAVFDMVTQSKIRSFSMGYDGLEYITDKSLDADVTMEMDLEKFKFTFKDNIARMNGLAFGFDGFIEMPADDILMDLNFGGRDLDMMAVLSLTPGDYTEYLKGVTARGAVNMNGYIRGIYNDTLMPAMHFEFGIADGFIRHADAPVPMEDIQVSAIVDIPTIDWHEASFVLDPFSFMLQNEPFGVKLIMDDLEDYSWDLTINGQLDLGSVTKIIPLPETTLTGKIIAALNTKGKYSDVEAEKYDRLPTSGSVTVANLYYQSADLSQGFGLTDARLAFNPKEITLSSFTGNAGKTDFNLTGKVTGYMEYALSQDGILKGSFVHRSDLVDVNEWMTESETEDTTALEVIRIPQNLDFTFSSSIKQLIYDDMLLDDFKGTVKVYDGRLDLIKTGFSILGGRIEMNGGYNTVPEKPEYDFQLKIIEMSIANSFKAFNTVRKLAPFAEKMTGNFSTDLKVNGLLGSDMMPIYETMGGSGLLSIASAAMQDVKLLSAISSVSSLNVDDGSLTLRDVLMNFDIEDGMVNVKPFNVRLGGYTTTIEGSNSIEGKLFYGMKVREVPTGAAGQAAAAALSSITGVSGLVSNKVDINLGVEGDFTKPQVKLLGIVPAGSKEGSGMGSVAKQALQEKIDAEKAVVAEKINETKQIAKDSVRGVVGDAKEQAQEEVEKAKEKAVDAAKDLLKRKKGGGK